MRVLLVTPVDAASGETITALHMAEKIVEHGDEILFLAAPFARRFLEKQFLNEIQDLTGDGDQNRTIWESSLREFKPDVIVFADYPLLFFSSGVCSLADKDKWVRSLAEVDACLITLDHAGFAQRAMGLFVGPPHLSFHYEEWPATPERMHILLPCPMNEPSPLAGRKGQPFRYWDVPLTLPDDQRRKVRGRYLDREDEFLIFYPVATWAWRIAQWCGLPYYRFLPEILEYYLADLPKPVTVVSVNNGDLLKQSNSSKIRIINLPILPKSEYEALLFASDLMITENNASITLGKAICGLIPCAVLHNSYRYRELLSRMTGELRQVVTAMEAIQAGSVFPYDSFPGGTEELEQLGLYRGNSLTTGFKELEIYGEEKTRHELRCLLTDEATRNALRAQQRAYVNKVQRLDAAEEVLHRLVEEEARSG